MKSKIKSVVVLFLLLSSVLFAFIPTVSAAVPVNSDPSPANAATGEDLNPTLQITINDTDGDTMNQTFWTNATGTWTQIGWNNNSANATVSNTTTCFSSYKTMYWWSSNVTDGLGGWDNDTYYFTTKWSGWSDNWTISPYHTSSGTGYEYGNWSFSEHIADGTLDELWTEANDTQWHVGDNSSWWIGNYTYCVNTTDVNSSFAVLNNSGTNRSQGFGWTHSNDTDNGHLYPYIIFAYNGSTDFDCVMWDPYNGGGHVWALNWNGTNMTDISTGNPVVFPIGNATDIDTGTWEYADYLTLEGNYYKYIYNELAGTLKFKYWSGGAFNEPAYWATQYQHTNITHDTFRGHGIGMWNPYGRETVMQWDLMNIWQLNYTTNSSTWCNISGYNESRPHMDFPVINISSWTDEMMTYFSGSHEGNISSDALRSMMKDNNTNLMNLESRMFESKLQSTGEQNDSVYYYSCVIDNYTEFDPESYDEWLHLHVQMCPDDQIRTDEYGDFVVAIDVDNNREWNTNDRFYWVYANDSYNLTTIAYNGNGDSIPVIYTANIWASDSNAIGNLHRYNTNLNYVISIPLADLVRSTGEPINASELFGISILTTTAGTLPLEKPCIWQNWNETSEDTFWDESDIIDNALQYFFNSTEEITGLPNTTTLKRWGEGEIGAGLDASGEISYNMPVNASFNDTSADAGEEYVHVNTSIWVNNTGAGDLNDIYVNVSWWNCSCSDLNMTFVDSNQDMSNWTWYNDSCYAVIHNVSNEPLTAGSSWHIWYNVNITNCSGVYYAVETLNITANATELASDVTLSGDSVPCFTWGITPIRLCIGYRTSMADVEDIGNSVFNIIGVLMVIGAILIIIGMVSKYYR